MQIILFVLVVAVWLFVLRVLDRADLKAWHFLVGAIGLFIIMMVWLQPVLTQPLAQVVTAISGLIGNLTGTFEAYFKYGVIFVPAGSSSITLQIDMECSGIIESMAFVALVAFFRAYTPYERIGIGAAGVALLILANVLRIVVICEIVHFCGVDAYSVAHTWIGRILFYGITVALYFYVFTKPQIRSMKVGDVDYAKRA
jgi:exosortase family protein XrtG